MMTSSRPVRITRCLNYVVMGGESCVVQYNHETELSEHGVEIVGFKIHI